MSFIIVETLLQRYANFAAFPTDGQSGVLYLDESNNKSYTWNGSNYVFFEALDPNAITSADVATETDAGIIEIATQAETDAGALDDKAVTPKKLKAFAQFGDYVDKTTDQSIDGIKTFLKDSFFINSPSTTGDLEIGYFPDIAPQAYGLRRSDGSGYLVLMPNSDVPQLVLGAQDNAAGAAYIDVDNNRPLFINVLDTGAGVTPGLVTIGGGGLTVIGLISSNAQTFVLDADGNAATFDVSANTAARAYTMPDKSGEVALNEWRPNSVPLLAVASSNVSLFANPAGVYFSFSGASDGSIFFNDTLNKSGNTYDGSNLSMRLYCRLSTDGALGDTVGLIVDYGIFKEDDNSSTGTTTLSQQNVNVETRNQDEVFIIDLGIMSGVSGGKVLMFTLTRNAAGTGADTFAGNFELIGMELQKV